MKGAWTITIGGVTLASPSTCIVNPVPVDGGPTIVEYKGYGAPAPLYFNLGNTAVQRAWQITQE